MTESTQKSSTRILLRYYNKVLPAGYTSRQWGEGQFKKHRWRLQAMYELDDIPQDAFDLYLRVFRNHYKRGRTVQDIFNVYRCAVWGRINNRSRQCFPNTHALQEGVGQVVVPMEDLDLHNAYERKAYNSNEYQTILEELSDVLLTLPEELRLALELLIQDFTGVSCIEQKKGKRLKAGKERIEPLSVALARKAKLDLHRDPIAELASWLKIETTAEE